MAETTISRAASPGGRQTHKKGICTQDIRVELNEKQTYGHGGGRHYRQGVHLVSSLLQALERLVHAVAMGCFKIVSTPPPATSLRVCTPKKYSAVTLHPGPFLMAGYLNPVA